MDDAQHAAGEALAATVEACAHSGLTEAWRRLVHDVYKGNLDRYEPFEYGDTPMSLGIQCSENLKVRALRRFRSHDAEDQGNHWGIDGLDVRTPTNALTFSLGQASVVTMKVPFGEGRRPNWHGISWDDGSQIRRDIATENSQVLRYESHAEEKMPMFRRTGKPGVVTNFMLVWAGEQNSPLTAGWLTVPILGEAPFVARERLWWDDEPGSGTAKLSSPDRGPRFDDRPTIAPQVTPKVRRRDGQA